MSKPTLLMVAACIAIMGTGGQAMAQSRQLELSLEQLFQTAEQHNTGIRSFQSAIEEAEQGIEVAKASRLPDVGASLSLSYLGGGFVSNRNFGHAQGIHIPHFGNNFAIQASWAVYTGGAIRSGIRLSELNARLARTQATDNEQKVRMLLVGCYLQLHNLQNQEQVFRENISLTQTLIDQTRSRQQAGVVLKNDITRYELQMENLKLGLAQVQARKAIVNHQLVTTLGLEEEVKILTRDSFEQTPERTGSESLWQEQAKNSAPTLQMAALGVEMSQQKERLERSALRPSIALVAEEHLDGPITIEIPNINKNLNYFFVGVGVKYNFDALYKGKRRVKKAQLATQTAQLQRQQADDRVNMAVQAAWTDYQTTFTELETNLKSMELAVQNYDVIHNRYTNGLALITDMVDAANQRLDAQLRLVNSRINVLYNFYNLKYTTGTL